MATKGTIDPIYSAFTKRVLKTISSTDFYEYFMKTMLSGHNHFQFSNTRVEKLVDESWVTAIEKCISPIEEIIANPRNFIVQEEVIVNIALAKKVTPDSIRHLSSHGDMVDKYDDKTGNIRPNRLMEKYKEDSWDTYENKFVYTLIDMAYDFVDKRYEVIFNSLQDEQGSHLIINSEAKNYAETITANVELRIQENEDIIMEDNKNESVFARIARLHRLLSNYKSTPFYKQVSKYGKVKPPLVPTNAIKKNPNFKACHKLWNFILGYTDVGYKIEIFKQSPEIDDEFAIDLYHSIMVDYIVLKHHLESKKDRIVDTTRPFNKKVVKPRFIKEIIEEIVKNYDLPDVEVRKVLIEEITKAQLMQEEENERLRLVAEKEKEMKKKRLAEEKEQKRREKEAEKLRQKEEREKEKEALRLEKEHQKELERQKEEEYRINQENLDRTFRIKNELDDMLKDMNIRRKAKAAEEKKKLKKEKKANKSKTVKEKKTESKKEPVKENIKDEQPAVQPEIKEEVVQPVEVVNPIPVQPVEEIKKDIVEENVPINTEPVKEETAVTENNEVKSEENNEPEEKKGISKLFFRRKK